MYLFYWSSLAFGESLEKTELVINEEKILVEIADEPHERGKGLMFRKEMAVNEGMLFVYHTEEKRSFWMKNTYIPLSIAYLDKNGTIVHLADMNPHEETAVPSIYPAQYALEMNLGWFEKHQIAVGMKVDNLPESK